MWHVWLNGWTNKPNQDWTLLLKLVTSITFNTHFSLSDKMDSSTITDIAQLSEIHKSKGFLFMLVLFEQKQICAVFLYIMSIQSQHYTTLQQCSTGGLAVSNHTFEQNSVARPILFLESLVQVWHSLVLFLHFPEGWLFFIEAAWDY